MPLANSAAALVSYIKAVKDAKGPINTPHGTLYPLLAADIDNLLVSVDADLEPSAAQVAKDQEKARKDAADKATKDAADMEKLKADIRKQIKDELHKEALLKEEADQMATISQLRAELTPQVAAEPMAPLTQAEKDKVAKDLKDKETENAKPDAKTPSAKPAPVTPPGPAKAVPTATADTKQNPAPASQQPKK